MHSSILLPIGLTLLLVAFALGILLLNERRYQRQRLIAERHRALGLPEGELVYEDADGQGEPLSSSAYPLVGKPDYIVQAPMAAQCLWNSSSMYLMLPCPLAT